MKPLENMYSKRLAYMIATPWFVEPISENDILNLQDKFLTNGFQRITVKDTKAGRALIDTFLYSFNTHHEIGCISLSPESLSSNICDIYYELVISKNLHNMEQFILDQFYFDFIWIEETPILLSKSWYQEFERLIIEYKLYQHIPVMILSYQ